MAHYAFLDDEGFVTEVIKGRDEWEVVQGISDWEAYYGSKRNQRCLRTSYNGNIRGRFAGIGSFYSDERDEFSAPKPFASWILNDDFIWEAPVPYPTDEALYVWNEENLSWVLADQEQ